MRDRGYRVTGLVLKRINVGEADKIITLFTRQRGKIVCLAPGIRKIISRRAGCLELFNKVSAYIVKGKNIDLVTEVELLESFTGPCFNSICQAYYLAELVDKLTAQCQENIRVYQLLCSWLGQNAGKQDNCLFASQLLVSLGFGLPEKTDRRSLEGFIEDITGKRINSTGLVS